MENERKMKVYIYLYVYIVDKSVSCYFIKTNNQALDYIFSFSLSLYSIVDW